MTRFLTKFQNVAVGNNSGFLSLSHKKSKVREIAKHNPIRNWCYMTRFLTNFQNVDVGSWWHCKLPSSREVGISGGGKLSTFKFEFGEIFPMFWHDQSKLGLLVVALATGKKKQVLYVALLCSDPPSWRFPVERGDQNVCGRFDIPTYYYISTIVPT